MVTQERKGSFGKILKLGGGGWNFHTVPKFIKLNQKDTEKWLKTPILFLPKYIAKSFVGREGAKIFTLFRSLRPNLKIESVSDWSYHREASAS